MTRSRTRLAAIGAVGAVAAMTALGLSACGSSSDEATKVAVTVADAGKGKYEMTAPSKVDGGLVELTLTNKGKEPHEAQLVRVDGGRTIDEVLKTVTSDSSKTPSWLHAEGGVGTVAPGQSGTSTVNLDPGHYAIVDLGAGGGKPPALSGSQTEFDASSGDAGDLPSTDATVTAAEAGKDKYEWQISGLKAGTNEITFNSKGDEALHHVIAAPLKGNASIDDVKKALESQSGPPPIDEAGIASTSVLDGGKSETTQLDLKPGRYAFICFLTDRDGGKPHFAEGLLKEVDISSG